jgi:hypothetical protein
MATASIKQSEYVQQYDKGMLASDIGFLSTLRRLWNVTNESCIPAIVLSYNRQSHMATVAPLVKNVYEQKSEITGELTKVYADRPSVSVPVVQFVHGAYEIDAPIFIGDTGFLIAGDRSNDGARNQNCTTLTEDQDTKEMKPNKGATAPDDFSLTRYASGFFIPCSFAQSSLVHDDGLIIRHVKNEEQDDVCVTIKLNKNGIEVVTDKNVSVKIDNDGIKISSPKYDTIDTISNIRYDVSSHQIQKKTITFKKAGNVVYDPVESTSWAMIDGGQAEEVAVNV